MKGDQMFRTISLTAVCLILVSTNSAVAQKPFKNQSGSKFDPDWFLRLAIECDNGVPVRVCWASSVDLQIDCDRTNAKALTSPRRLCEWRQSDDLAIDCTAINLVGTLLAPPSNHINGGTTDFSGISESGRRIRKARW